MLTIHAQSTSLIYRTNCVFAAIEFLERLLPLERERFGEQNFRYSVKSWVFSKREPHTLEKESVVASFLAFYKVTRFNSICNCLFIESLNVHSCLWRINPKNKPAQQPDHVEPIQAKLIAGATLGDV